VSPLIRLSTELVDFSYCLGDDFCIHTCWQMSCYAFQYAFQCHFNLNILNVPELSSKLECDQYCCDVGGQNLVLLKPKCVSVYILTEWSTPIIPSSANTKHAGN
jgi:hypothetical protein